MVNPRKREKYLAFVEARRRLNSALPSATAAVQEGAPDAIVSAEDVPRVSRLVEDVQSTWPAYQPSHSTHR